LSDSGSGSFLAEQKSSLNQLQSRYGRGGENVLFLFDFTPAD
jgi:hypothetical protein